MFLKNYTSTVAPSVTIYRIEQLLIRIRAARIAKEYSPAGEMKGILFQIEIEAGKPVTIKLPADVEGALNALWLDYASGERLSGDGNEVWGNGRKRKRKAEFRKQAECTAWKLMQDWLEVQVSMIQLKQADFLQVFLPYAWDGRRSYYQSLKEGGFRALMPPASDER